MLPKIKVSKSVVASLYILPISVLAFLLLLVFVPIEHKVGYYVTIFFILFSILNCIYNVVCSFFILRVYHSISNTSNRLFDYLVFFLLNVLAGYHFWRKIKKKEKAGEIEIVLQWQVSVIDVFYIVGVFIAIVSSKLMYDA
ncbi:hypothetical protein N483_13100 [Pseudoalteromonas luteoviolacea NCIMB 1944]|uniref:Uncharacterized protein n=1 Tax=Pseudoalteromonas luteoviolacea (strain 2ta16) TaxID=1353533 RepID=V4JF65_PSEL2|nr:hypothetical protein PL2TA16_03048 [Pseudoalteromonas luteoviolacea 2ta16]KZN42452.1 hypothetical protein N483_13100 [Pseudoalteromonas luteoviolacea NCIMB 1944]